MVGVNYRPPRSDVSYWRKLENNIQSILDLNIPVILGGGLNIDMLGNQCGHLEDILTRLYLILKFPRTFAVTTAQSV